MPVYNFTAKKGTTEIVKSSLEAESQDKAVTMIEAMGLFPIKVVEKASESAPVQSQENASPNIQPKREGMRVSIKVSARDMDAMMWQLASLVKSNIPLLRALALIAKQTKNKSLKMVVSDMENHIKDGELLSGAMGKYPELFTNLTTSMIRAGEKSGSLDEVLHKLAEYREKEQEIRRKPVL